MLSRARVHPQSSDMTSETSAKVPLILSSSGGRSTRVYYGMLVVLLCWLYIYFQVIGTLYDGVVDFFYADSVKRVATPEPGTARC